jgi:endogenous inhibitor of DNA gyrase (YacG/DUF329 family)
MILNKEWESHSLFLGLGGMIMVTCKICGKEMHWIQNTHLRQHGMSLSRYRELYPDESNMDDYMKDYMQKTRYTRTRTPIKLCAREGCSNPVSDWRHNKYCSNSCRSKDYYKETLGIYATPQGNPWYVDGEYARQKSQKRLAYERDEGRCVICGKEVDGKNEKYGVHHIIPRRLFEDKVKADELANLVTLCNSHHKQSEEVFTNLLFELYTAHDYKSVEDLQKFILNRLLSL